MGADMGRAARMSGAQAISNFFSATVGCAAASRCALALHKPNQWRLAGSLGSRYVHVLFTGEPVMKPTAFQIACFVAVLAVVLVVSFTGGALTSKVTADGISYADFIAVMLTSVSVLVALLAIFLAVLAVVGWNAIVAQALARVEKFLADDFKTGTDLSNKFEKRAEEIVAEYLRENFKEGRTLAEMVRKHARHAALEGISPMDEFASDAENERKESER